MTYFGALRLSGRRGAMILVTIAAALAAVLGLADPSGADDYGRNTAFTTLPGINAIDRGILPNDGNHTYCVDHAPGYEDRIHAAMANLDAQTNMTVELLTSCEPALNGGKLPDVDWYVGDTVFQDLRQWVMDNFGGLDIGDLPESWGITLCKAPFGIQLTELNNRVCNSSVVAVPTDRIRAGIDPGLFDVYVSNILCHELGHTVGLEHHGALEQNPMDAPSEYEQDGPLDWGCTEYPDFSSCQNLACVFNEIAAKLRYHPHHVAHINGYLACRAAGGVPVYCDGLEDFRVRVG